MIRTNCPTKFLHSKTTGKKCQGKFYSHSLSNDWNKKSRKAMTAGTICHRRLLHSLRDNWNKMPEKAFTLKDNWNKVPEKPLHSVKENWNKMLENILY